MAKAGIFVCLVIVLVDFAAGFLGFQAHITKDKVRYMNVKRSECQQLKNKAFKFGLIAAVLLALSHVSANLLGACMCICCTEKLEKSSANRKFWFGCLVLSWIVVAVGFPALVMGMLEIPKSKGSCHQVLHHHSLLAGGILCFVHAILSVGFYVSANVSFEKDVAVG
ncbi:Transcription factor [Hibiscus syriacus]|uniref:Transcription factor n=1 Tax=Hibiscus syriacus TaxID=106335 RepID=A0A6A2WYW3_HIBSY|nr:Transcription factor [Hibiscus syriacus]